ncbi:MAG TPA: hypothetical protein VGO93_29260 [Candidatus Xenobia bacterium]
MTLHHGAPGLQGSLVDGIRQLAQAAAHTGDDAAFPQHASEGEPSIGRSTPDVLPEAEQPARGNQRAVQVAARDTQILHLAQLPMALDFGQVGP